MVLVWGVNFAVVKSAIAEFEPLTFNALRHLLASAFMIAVLGLGRGIGRPARGDIRKVIYLGFMGVIVYQLAFIFGLDRTRAGNASLMIAVVPIFLLLFGRRSGEGGKAAWLGALVSIAGVALVSGSTLRVEGTDSLLGDLILLGAAAAWAVYTVGAGPLIRKYGPIRTTAWTLWAGSIGLCILGIPSILSQDWGAVSSAAWGGVIYSAIFAIGISYLLWYRGVELLGGTRTAVFSNLTPVFALAAAALWLDESLTIYSYIGAAMVIGGLLLVRRAGTRAGYGSRTASER